jgi:hypothetical protein
VGFNEFQLPELVALLEPHGVRFDPRCENDGEGWGVFRAYAVAGPTLAIYRPLAEHVAGEWERTREQRREAAIRFLPEYGHVLSWSSDKERWFKVHAARVTFECVRAGAASPSEGLSEDERRLVLDEREIAWRNAPRSTGWPRRSARSRNACGEGAAPVVAPKERGRARWATFEGSLGERAA